MQGSALGTKEEREEMTLHPHFSALAAYNRWANRRLYGAIADVPAEAYRQDRGAFFGSLCGTLNHILVADRMWLFRLTGKGPLPSRLDEILYDEFAPLRQAREAEDERIIAVVDSFGEVDWDRILQYRRASGKAEFEPDPRGSGPFLQPPDPSSRAGPRPVDRNGDGCARTRFNIFL